MILLVHEHNIVVEVLEVEKNLALKNSFQCPIKEMFNIAENYSDAILVWCHISQKNNLNLDALRKSFHLKNMMISYSRKNYLPNQIGYVEESPFLNVNKSVVYPTWQMSSQIGVIHTSQLLKFNRKVYKSCTFDYALNSMAKLGITKGLFCYSNPLLLKDKSKDVESKKGTIKELFRFVKHHYKSRWLALLFLNILWHDGKFPFYSLVKTVFNKRIKQENIFEIQRLCSEENLKNYSLDVIIPTIGRKKYLHNVLKDLAVQTLLPKKVIIVEQNPQVDSVSELDFLKSSSWPFQIVHHFTHTTGACNARNIALKEVNADFVYLADDDNRFDKNLLSKIIETIKHYSLDVITMSYLKRDEVEVVKQPIQWSSFGSGSSVISSKYLKEVKFNMALEHGYGEDVDFGMQLRNKGADVIYFPNIKIEHLKAPIGGFRTKFVNPWEQDAIQPKPSPTVMLNKISNLTYHQLLGYKTILFFKYYRNQNIKNPVTYFKAFKKQWIQSLYWAKTLKQKRVS